jgi:hypothetical protein
VSTLADEFVRIRPDLTGFPEELKTKAEMGAGETGKGVGKKVAGGVVEGIATVFAAEKIVDFFKDAFKEAEAAAKVGRLTEAVIKSTGGAADVTSKEVRELAESLSNVAGVDHTVIQNSENVLLTFTRVRNEAGKGNDIFNQATAAALNLSSALGTDLQAASILVGKALNDPIGGLTALKKAGIQFTDAQKEQIKTMIAAGDQMGAQKIILGELTAEFGGAAAAAATPADKAKVAWQDFEESVGAKLLPMLNDILTFGVKNQKWLAPLVTSAAALGVAVIAVTAAEKVWAATQAVLGVGLEGNVGKIKKTTLAIAGLAVAAQAINAATSSTIDVDGLTDSIKHLGDANERSGELVRLFGPDLKDFGKNAALAGDGWNGAARSLEGFIPGVKQLGQALNGANFEDAQANIQAVDAQLAQLARSGNADEARAAALRLMQAGKLSFSEFAKLMPQYTNAMAQADRGTTALGVATQKAADAGKNLLDTWNELNGTMLDADHAALEADKAIAGLADTFKGTTHSIDANSMAGLENRVALEDAASAASKAAAAYLENGGTAADAAGMMARYEAAAIKSTGATGKNKDAVKALADQLFQLPTSKTITITVATAGIGAALGQVGSLERAFAAIAGFHAAKGGVLNFFAQGGFEDHVAQIVSAGTMRVWAEPETGGEAYLPLAPSKRARSTAVLSDVAKRFGYGLVPAGGAGGSVVAAAGPSPAAGSLHRSGRSPLHIQNFYAAPAHSEYRLAQELDWLSRGGG